MTREEMEMRKLVRESDVIDKTNGTELARAFNHLWNKYIEQEPILDKIRAEIEEKFEGCDICEWFEDYDYEENDISEYHSVGDITDILQIIDKYKGRR